MQTILRDTPELLESLEETHKYAQDFADNIDEADEAEFIPLSVVLSRLESLQGERFKNMLQYIEIALRTA